MNNKNSMFCKTVLIVITAAFLLVFSSQSFALKQNQKSKTPATAQESIVKVNINTAGAVELTKIPGIGEGLAGRIIKHRTESGIFKKPEDLMIVKGIGEKKFQKMTPYITVR